MNEWMNKRTDKPIDVQKDNLMRERERERDEWEREE